MWYRTLEVGVLKIKLKKNTESIQMNRLKYVSLNTEWNEYVFEWST